MRTSFGHVRADATLYSPRRHMKITETSQAANHAGECGWYRRIDGVGVVRLSVDFVVMDFGAERALGLGGGTAEADPGAAASDVCHGKALAGQPLGDFVDIGLAHAKAIGVLLGSEPLVVFRGGLILEVRGLPAQRS